MQAWIAEEVASADLGDERLDRRFALLLDRLSARPNVSIPAACKGRAEIEAAYRFFDNERVTPDKILAPHRDATIRRVQEQAVVLVVQDTTELDLTRAREEVGGPLNEETRRGFLAHELVVFTPHAVPLGVLHAQMWARDPETFGTSTEAHKHKPIEEEESYRWLQGYRQACALAEQAPQAQVVCVSDSEGDIYECFLEAAQRRGRQAHWVVRACQDRCLTEGTEGKLYAEVAASRKRGTLTIEVSRRAASSRGDDRKRRQARHARQTQVEVRARAVVLQAPQRPGQEKLPPLVVHAVLVREVKPSPGEEPIEWLLLTDLPIGSWKEVGKVLAYYTVRWAVEIYFRVLKSGCKVEERQLETDERMRACLALYMIVAWRVLFVTMLGRECPDLPCTVVFEGAEWRAVYMVVENQPAPKRAPRLVDLVEMIASLGGYQGRKCDGPPGPQTMWIGMQRMRDLATAWCTFGPGASPTSRRPRTAKATQ